MRGKENVIKTYTAETRITPAYAGKSFRRLSGLFSVQDHPRLCGEKPYFYDAVTQRVGSPPPMRGKGQGITLTKWETGITPAYAGKSVSVQYDSDLN